ncbi:MAG: SDR family oxidoreductase [Candidatus Levybacteria bacterium]|nr:SDR family oxidoreductase [Candidatus Levybacteria bacterium]
MKPKIIGFGLNGLIGSRIVELLSDKYEFISLGRSTGVDITDPESLTKIKEFPGANFVLHLAAKTDVDGCEEDKNLGEEGEAWKVNVEGSKNVAQICRESGKKLIYISTDFVFDGRKSEGEKYGENDYPNPINWYGKTKYGGERAVAESGADYITLRLAYPYRASEAKKDFFRTILESLGQGVEIKAVTDHIFCPTFIDDIASALDKLIENDATGIYHVVGADALTPYEAAFKIAEIFGLDKSLVDKTTRVEFFANRAPRPYNLGLKNDKITGLGVRMRGFEEGLLEVKKQISES